MFDSSFATQNINFTISFPSWFYGILTIGIVSFIFYLGKLHTKLDDVCKDHPKIREALTRISELLLQKDLAKSYIYHASPLKLTAEGIKAIEDAKFKEFYDKNKKILSERIQKTSPKTLADLEEATKQIMLEMEDSVPNFESLKQYAYQHGEPISKILFACAIELRDLMSEELKIKE